MNAIEISPVVQHAIFLKSATEHIVLSCGVRVDLIGFTRLVEAMTVYTLYKPRTRTDIYRIISEVTGLKEKTVRREIEYAVNKARHRNAERTGSHRLVYDQIYSRNIFTRLRDRRSNNDNRTLYRCDKTGETTRDIRLSTTKSV